MKKKLTSKKTAAIQTAGSTRRCASGIVKAGKEIEMPGHYGKGKGMKKGSKKGGNVKTGKYCS